MKTLIAAIMILTGSFAQASIDESTFLCKSDADASFAQITDVRKEFKCGEAEKETVIRGVNNTIAWSGGSGLHDCTFTDDRLVSISRPPNSPAYEYLVIFKIEKSTWKGKHVLLGNVTCTEYKKAE